MYDIKIFLEDNGQFGARLNVGKETIYGIGNNQEELMQNLKEGFLFSQENKEKNKKVSRLFSYFNSTKNQVLCH